MARLLGDEALLDDLVERFLAKIDVAQDLLRVGPIHLRQGLLHLLGLVIEFGGRMRFPLTVAIGWTRIARPVPTPQKANATMSRTNRAFTTQVRPQLRIRSNIVDQSYLRTFSTPNGALGAAAAHYARTKFASGRYQHRPHQTHSSNLSHQAARLRKRINVPTPSSIGASGSLNNL